MFEFDATHRAISEAIRKFCDREIAPVVARIESGDLSSYEVMRGMSEAFGLEEALAGPLRRKVERLRGGAEGDRQGERTAGAGHPELSAIFAKEIARVSPCLQ